MTKSDELRLELEAIRKERDELWKVFSAAADWVDNPDGLPEIDMQRAVWDAVDKFAEFRRNNETLWSL